MALGAELGSQLADGGREARCGRSDAEVGHSSLDLGMIKAVQVFGGNGVNRRVGR